MSTKTFAEVTNDARTMIAGLKSHADQVSKRGADNAFVTQLDTLLQKTVLLDSQEAELKAQLKLKSAELEAEFTALKANYSEARKIVKLSVEQAGWKAFGIEDMR